ncbi:MAG TPA: hypothetical protein VEL11_11575 [Candidatus Bathyarchaeia archaeon]|nr:hypothetical protein [Candidatus Bathyarchaeia archaeon]
MAGVYGNSSHCITPEWAWQKDSLYSTRRRFQGYGRKKMIENIPTPLVSFAGSGVAHHFLFKFPVRIFFGTMGIPATSRLAIGLLAGLAKS